MKTEAIIEFQGISKSFTDFQLQEVNLTLLPGEVHVIVGENGSGKSTLMKLLGGYFPPDSGTMLFKGSPYPFEGINQALRGGILYLHQELHNFDNLSVAENIFFNNGPKIWKLTARYPKERVIHDCRVLFEELGINLEPEQLLGFLGYAEKQLISAVRAYAAQSQVVIFDEPSSAMSDSEREILFEIIRRMQNRGTSLFYISHRMDEIRKVGDRLSLMEKGKIMQTSTIADLDKAHILKLMTSEVHPERYPRLDRQIGEKILTVEKLACRPILKNISFDLHQGEILGITGLMGSGRTLLANCLFGSEKPYQGKILIKGKEYNFSHPEEAIKAGIALIPEDRVDKGIFAAHNLVSNLTAASLTRFQENHILDERIMNQLSKDYVQQLSINPGGASDLLYRYSGGNQQKVLVGRWLMKQAPIYIMDEPTRGIDIAAKVDLYNTMNDMAGKGAAILLISSEIEEILGMCDRILVLSGGRIKADMPREKATKERILEYATDES